MIRRETVNVLLHAIPPVPALGVPGRFHTESGFVVRCFTCTHCGYTELYSVGVAEPNLWPGVLP